MLEKSAASMGGRLGDPRTQTGRHTLHTASTRSAASAKVAQHTYLYARIDVKGWCEMFQVALPLESYPNPQFVFREATKSFPSHTRLGVQGSPGKSVQSAISHQKSPY